MRKKSAKVLMMLVILSVLFTSSFATVQAHNSFLNVKTDFTAVGNGTTDDRAALQNAINEVANDGGGTILFPVGTYKISSNITFPDNCTLFFLNGAKLAPDSGVTVTINGSVVAKYHQIFSGQGTIAGLSRVEWVYPQWFGAKGDGSTNDTAAFQKVFLGFKNISIPKGTYLITDTVTIPYNSAGGPTIKGAGKEVTTIKFLPTGTSDKVLFKINDTPQSILYRVNFSGMLIFGANNFDSSDATCKRIGFQITNASEVIMQDVQLANFSRFKSIGLQIRGRELSTYSRITIRADIPVSLEKNPDPWEVDLDSTHFEDLYLMCTDSAEACVKVEASSMWTGVIFDGRQSWIGGKYGLYWNDSGGIGISHNVVLRNVRYEQPLSQGYIVYINHSYGLWDLILDNVTGGAGTECNGFYFRKCNTVNLINCMYSGSAEALNMDNSCRYVQLVNTFIQDGSTVNTNNGMDEIYSYSRYALGQSVNALYQTKDSASKYVKVTGSKSWCFGGTIAAGGSVEIPIDSITSCATILVTTDNYEGGMFSAANNVVGKISGTAYCVAGYYSPGYFCVYYDSGSGKYKVANTGTSARKFQIAVNWN